MSVNASDTVPGAADLGGHAPEPWQYNIASILRHPPYFPGKRRLVDTVRKLFQYRDEPRDGMWTTIRNYDGDLRMELDPGSDVGADIFWHGHQHLPERRYLSRTLTPESVFIDVGANVGEFTLFAAKRATRGVVIAVEPRTDIRARLAKSIESNGFTNAKTFGVGLGRRTGQSTLGAQAPADGPENGHRQSRAPDAAPGTNETMLTTLDALVASQDLRKVDVVKIGVDGAELGVLQGGRRILSAIRPKLILQINPTAFRRAGYETADIAAGLRAFGYSIRAFTSDGGVHAIDLVAAAERCPRFNVLCHPD